MASIHPSISLDSLVDSQTARSAIQLLRSRATKCYRPPSPGRDLGAKPLPPLPGGWTRVCHETSLFLRSIGLTIIVSTLSGFFNRHYDEPTKVAVRKSRLTATLRAFIHLPPLGLALLEIIINWWGLYYGKNFDRQAYYQIIAKAHEIMIQASLALIVLSYIRYESVFGKGVPFGTFLGGLRFLQVSYLWSPELWSSVTATSITLKKKLAILATLIVGGILATTVGPSSATLLIPRSITWQLQPSHFALNGSFQDVWPDHVDGRNIPGACGVLSSADVSNRCPGEFWKELASNLAPAGSTLNSVATLLLKNGQAVVLHDPLGSQAAMAGHGTRCLTSRDTQQCASIVQDIVTHGAYTAFVGWKKNVNFTQSTQDVMHRVSEGYYQPYTTATCFSDTIDGTNIRNPIQFPRLAETDSVSDQDNEMLTLPNITKGQVLETPGNFSEFRFKWLELPFDLFKDRPSGVILLHPMRSTSYLNITTCTLGAGWGTSTAIMSEALTGIFYSQVSGTPKSWPVQSEITFQQDATISVPSFGNLSGFVYPQRRITLSKDWLEYLNPVVPVTKTVNTTAMHAALTSDLKFSDEKGISQILSLVLACGLARKGIDLGLQGLIPASFPNMELLITRSPIARLGALRWLPDLFGGP